MTLPLTSHTFGDNRDEDFAARSRRIRDRILDGIEATLDELAEPDVLRVSLETGIDRASPAQSHLFCPRALCRRAGRCRGRPCGIDARASDARDAMQPDRHR